MKHAQWMRALCVALPLLFTPTLHAELIFSSPPRENATQAEQDYAPLVDLLSRVLGEKVTHQPPASWAAYSQAMQDDRYDIVFDGSHFVAWRMTHTKHKPLVRLPGTLAFVTIVRADNPVYNLNDLLKPNQLLNQTVCVAASPSLAANVLLAEYGPIVHPRLRHPRNDMAGVYAAFLAGECSAAMVRDVFFDKKLPEAERSQLRTIFRSRQYPNQALTASRRISPDKQAALIAALKAPENHAAIAPLMARFVGNAEAKLVPAYAEEYADLSQLLEKQVWGWDRTSTLADAASHR